MKNETFKIGPITKKILESIEKIERLESQIQSEEMKRLKREGIRYYQPKDEG